MSRIVLALTYPAYVLLGMVVFFSFSGSLTGEFEYRVLLLSVTFVVWSLVLFQEYFFPFREDWKKGQGDILSDALQSAIIFPLISDLIYKGYNLILHQPLKSFWPHDLPASIQLLLILVICEYGHYWYHRISHRKKWLWKYHTIHHGALRVYSVNSARFHLVDILFNMLAYLIPLSLFGVSDEVFYSFLTLNSVTGLLEHANIKFEAGVLNYFFNSAQLHRWHHSEVGSESQTNFGKVLCVWDLVHGTHFLPKGKVVGTAGIRGKKIPPTFIAQTKYPFGE